MKVFFKYLIYFTLLLCLASCSVANQLFGVEKGDSWPSTDSLMTAFKCRGTLQDVVYKCSVKGPTHRRMLVYLPEGYHDSDKRYPVLYMLHGARGNETSWIVKGEVLPMLDSLRHYDLAEDFIVVFPNMNQYNDDKDFNNSRFKRLPESFVDMDGAVESSFFLDVVKNVDNMFRTIPTKQGRAIAGLSFGAYQAMYISAHYPDEFDYIGLFSPCYRAHVSPSPYSNFYKSLMRYIRAQFRDHKPHMYVIAIGYWDIYYNNVEEFRRKLSNSKIEFEYIETDGGHSWKNWKGYADEFFQRIF